MMTGRILPGQTQWPATARQATTRAAAFPMGWNHGMGTHQVPPDSIPNAGLTEELDRRIGTAAAHAVSNVPMAKPDENVGSVLDGMRGSTFASAVVVAVCTNGRLVGLAPVERLLAAPADAVLGDVMDSDPPTQTETLAIRGLSVGIGIGRIARREALTGLLVGCLLAATMLPLISWLWHDPALAAAVS